MRMFLVPLAGLGLAALAAEAASAASPAYCALYAREYANQMVQVGAPAKMTISVQDQAYYRCLNQDEDPTMPTASAYFGADVEDPGPVRALAATADGNASKPTTVSQPASTTSKSTRRSGTLVAWSPQWVAKCKKYYPNSFDPKTGTVLPYHASSRRMCPY
jgi:hypothetical protein